MPTHMRAMVLTQVGGPDRIELVTVTDNRQDVNLSTGCLPTGDLTFRMCSASTRPVSSSTGVPLTDGPAIDERVVVRPVVA